MTGIQNVRLVVAGLGVSALVGAALAGLTIQPAVAAGFFNPATIPIGPSAGASVSSIVVTGQPPVTSDVSVTINDFSHALPWDVDLLLEGPTGVRVMLMSDHWGTPGSCVANGAAVDYTFSDHAATTLGPQAPAGTYKPTDIDGSLCESAAVDTLVPSPTATVLSAFNGTNPNGTWKLHVADDDGSNVNVGQILGWFLDISADNPPPAPATCAGLTPTITGTEGADTRVGTPGPDVIAGLGGDDVITGLGGDDVICGGDGNDKLKGGAGIDRLYGDAGRDKLRGGGAKDSCFGGADKDAIGCEKAKQN